MPEVQQSYETKHAGVPTADDGGAADVRSSEVEMAFDAKGVGRAVANPESAHKAIGAAFARTDLNDLEGAAPLREGLVRVALRALWKCDDCFETVSRSKEGDPSFVHERIRAGLPIDRFTELDWEIEHRLREAADGLAAMVGLVGIGAIEGAGSGHVSANTTDRSPSKRNRTGGKAASQGGGTAEHVARETLRKLFRLSLGQIAERAERFETLQWKERLRARWNEPLVPAARYAASGGRVWEVLTTLASVDAIGKRFKNCLGRPGTAERYQRAMLDGEIRIAVLRDAKTTSKGAARKVAGKGGGKGERDRPPYREHVLAAWNRSNRRLIDLEAAEGEDVPGRFREDVRQLLVRCNLRSDGHASAVGLVAGTVRSDPEPWMEGIVVLPPGASPTEERYRGRRSKTSKEGSANERPTRHPYRVWSFKGRVLVEVGRTDPLYAHFALDPSPLSEQRTDDLGDAAPEAPTLAPSVAARVLADAAMHADKVPHTVGRLLALVAREAIARGDEREAPTARRRR